MVYIEIFIFLYLIEIKSAIYKTNNVKSPSSSYFLKTVLRPLTAKEYFSFLYNNNNIVINDTLTESSIFQGGKQYKIVNMIWKKTKIFVDIESNTESYRPRKKDNPRIATTNIIQHRNPLQLSLNPIRIHTSTPSYIEFYYLQELHDFVQNSSSFKSTNYSGDKVSKMTLKQTEDPTNIQCKICKNRCDFQTYKLSITNNTSKTIMTIIEKSNLSIKNKFNKRTTKNYTNTNNLKLNKEKYPIKSTTFYDKIKFFEIYDNQTEIPVIKKHLQNSNYSYNISNRPRQVLLEHIRGDVGYVDNKTRHYVKKHIEGSNKLINIQDTERSTENVISTQTSVLLDVWLENNKYYDTTTVAHQDKHVSNTSTTFFNYVNKSTLWTEYPFIAVYIYKPLQVHCDAAGISPHWLIASAACLSRHHGNLERGGQSPFVTFCGSTWWLPERIAYVKYSQIHPRYHPHDRIRRQLYNIGVIKIVNSMASACPNWSPVPLMSHLFTANTGGSKAKAVGWGLDRFNTRYTSTELPKRPLASYESLIHSESCQGYLEYSKEGHIDRDLRTRNLYCLSLPPYSVEENGPIHGSILLVEEKLVALYLQEERRPRGEQSAQYTGTWRLIPWIFDVAREFSEADIFTVEA